jgi:hypothetical protein
MSDFEGSRKTTTELAALTSELRVRVLNCSAAGCLVETTRRIPIGMVATLRVSMSGRQFSDTVRVVRCQMLQGAGGVYHVGMEFLSIAPPYAGSMRHMVRHECEAMSGWLDPERTV